MIAVSNFVWNIEIECDGEIDKENIVEIARESGLEMRKVKKIY